MWIFSVTPDWVFHGLFYASILAALTGTFLKNVPFIKQYALLLKYGGIGAFVISTFLEGALYDYNVMQDRVKQAKEQAEAAEKANVETNEKLAKLQEDFKKKNKAKTEYIYRYIDREIVKYDTKFMPGGICEIPQEFFKAHNDAAGRIKNENK